MSRKPLTEEVANKIYDVLQKHVGATDFLRENFVQFQTTEYCREFRFQGSLGFGGKFWRPYGWRVDCYREDSTYGREKLIELANKELKILQEELAPTVNFVFLQDGRVEIDGGEAVTIMEAKIHVLRLYEDQQELCQVALGVLEKEEESQDNAKG